MCNVRKILTPSSSVQRLAIINSPCSAVSLRQLSYLFENVCTYTVFQKSDAKIQITITMAHLVRSNYPLSSLNYRLSGTNVANFNKIHHMVSEQQRFKHGT